jgi:murein DD-endopeptidase MepM/ murein hydrolase activator NlpD
VTLGTEEFLALEAARRGKTRLPYVARPGDTLAKIARRYGLAPGDLARINRLSYSSELKEGQTIYVYSPTPEMPREVSLGRAPRRRGAAVSTAVRDKAARSSKAKAPVPVKSAPARRGGPAAARPSVR